MPSSQSSDIPTASPSHSPWVPGKAQEPLQVMLVGVRYLLSANRTGFTHLLDFEKDAVRVAQDAVVAK